MKFSVPQTGIAIEYLKLIFNFMIKKDTIAIKLFYFPNQVKTDIYALDIYLLNICYYFNSWANKFIEISKDYKPIYLTITIKQI